MDTIRDCDLADWGLDHTWNHCRAVFLPCAAESPRFYCTKTVTIERSDASMHAAHPTLASILRAGLGYIISWG